MFWDEAVAASPGVLPPAALESEHPYLIAYTSGTTGKPKGAVHATGGFLVKIAAEVAYHADAHTGDRILFATDLGWIMGPWTHRRRAGPPARRSCSWRARRTSRALTGCGGS